MIAKLREQPTVARAHVLLLFLVLVLFGCVRPSPDVLRPLLNSERIAKIFGSYGIEVLENDALMRVSNLYSLHGERRVCRTFAVTFFAAEIDERLATPHGEIVAGGSIGAVFKKALFVIGKKTRYLGEIASGSSRLRDLMGLAATQALAVHLYDLSVSTAGMEPIAYATLVEIHHPDFLSLEDLRAIHRDEAAALPARPDAEVARLLERAVKAAD